MNNDDDKKDISIDKITNVLNNPFESNVSDNSATTNTLIVSIISHIILKSLK